MKRILFLGLLLASILSHINAQTTQDRNLSGFSKLKVQSAIKLIITIGESYKVKVEAEEKNMDKILTEVKNDELKIYSKEGYQSKKGVVVYVTLPVLNALNASGATEVSATTLIPSKSFKLDVYGASSVRLELKSDDIALTLSGASVVTLNGSVARLNASISGASSLKALELNSNTVDVTASGASSAKISATAVLKANASGASSIRYSGEPKDKTIDTSGASDIKKI
jgi:hypothetical protein